MSGAEKPPCPATWTVEWACAELAEQFGVHVNPRHLRLVLRGLPGLAAVAEMPPGPYGGRGAKLYPLGDIQALAGFLIRRGWLQSDPVPEKEARDRRRGLGKRAGPGSAPQVNPPGHVRKPGRNDGRPPWQQVKRALP